VYCVFWIGCDIFTEATGQLPLHCPPTGKLFFGERLTIRPKWAATLLLGFALMALCSNPALTAAEAELAGIFLST